MSIKEIQEKLEKEGESALSEDELKEVMSASPEPGGDADDDKTEDDDYDDPNRTVDIDEPIGIKKAEENEEKKAEEKPSDKVKKADGAGEPKKKPEDANGEDEEPNPERKTQIKDESSKPLSEANLEDYTPRERAYYFDLRKERRKRQDAQRERDELKFTQLKDRVKEELGETVSNKKIDELLKDMEDDDVVTVQDIKEALKTQKAETKTDKKVESPELPGNNIQAQLWIMQGEKKTGDPEFERIVDLAPQLLNDNKEAIAEVQEAVNNGENAAIVTYKLIKNHPDYAEIAKKLKIGDGGKDKKTEDQDLNKERKKRIEDNAKKTVTTGSGGGSAPTGEYSLKELLAMPEEDFGKLPTEKREQILQSI